MTTTPKNGQPVQHKITPKAARATTPKKPRPTPARSTPVPALNPLEVRVAQLEQTVSDMGKVLAGFIEQQTVAQTMAAIEGQLRQQVRANIAENGWKAALPQEQPPT